MITLKQVNKALKQAGHKEELVRSSGYFCFTGGNAEKWVVSGVYVYRLNQLSVDQWIDERNNLAKMRY